MIRAVIFDFAGVIGTDGYWVWLRKQIPNLAEKEAGQKDFQHLSDEVDSGKISNSTYLKKLAKLTGVNPETIWPEIFKNVVINTELVSILGKLKQKYKVGLLSNYTHEWLEHLLRAHHLNLYFDDIVISSKIKTLKPHWEIFQRSLNNLGVSAQEAVFIDDRQIHVDAANKVGIRGVLYTTNEILKKDLESFGVKV